jgi:hypothetical protein
MNSPTETQKPAKVEFPLPAGAALPEDASKPFDMVCTFEAKPDGKMICMTKFGDAPMPGYSDDKNEQKPEAKPDYGSGMGMAGTDVAGAQGGAGGGMGGMG